MPCAKAPRAVTDATALKDVSDRKLLLSIKKLSDRERETVFSILVHLIEIDRRRLYLEMGYNSLFELCVKNLGYSESVAGRKISVARCIRRLPMAFRALASGKVTLTSLGMITGIITAENASDLLSRIAKASRKEIELLVSSRRPRSVIPDRVKAVYVRTEILVSDARSGEKGELQGSKSLDGRAAVTPVSGSGKSPNSEDVPGVTERRVVLEERFEVKFGADQEFIEKIERLRSLLSTKHHRRLEFAELFSIAMDEYIERHSPEGRTARKEKRERDKARQGQLKAARTREKAENEVKKASRASRTAKASRPAAGDPQKKEASRYISQKVRDEVYARDHGRCAYVSPGGRKCHSTWDLQVDHVIPFAKGGDNSRSNLRLLCGKHNRLEAERAYGKKQMEQYARKHKGEHLKEQTERYDVKHWKNSMERYVKEQPERYDAKPSRKQMARYLKEPGMQYAGEQVM